MPQQMEGEPFRRRGGGIATVNRDVALGRAFLHAQVPPVDVGQRLVDDLPQPDKHRRRMLPQERFQLAGGVEIGLLQHIVGPDAAINSPIEPEIHDPPQPGPLQIKQLCEGDPVAVNHPVTSSLDSSIVA